MRIARSSLMLALAVPLLAGCARVPPATVAAPAFPARAEAAIAWANANSAGGPAYRGGWFGDGDERLHYVEAGEGPLIILHHGFPSFWLSMFDQMETLKRCYRVVAVDGLGGGASAKPASIEPYRIERLAARVDALARHLSGDARYAMIGHDWGAALAWSMAQAWPDRMRAVVAMSAPPTNLFLTLVRDDAEQQQRSGYMQRFRSVDRAMLEGGVAVRIASGGYAALAESGAISAERAALLTATLSDPATMDGGMNWYRANVPPFDRIDDAAIWPSPDATTDVPVLAIWGEADETFVPGWLTRASAHARRLEILRLPGVGHWTPMERPAETNAAITRFLAQHAPGRCG
jgi:epoxide hydrolase 4